MTFCNHPTSHLEVLSRLLPTGDVRVLALCGYCSTVLVATTVTPV